LSRKPTEAVLAMLTRLQGSGQRAAAVIFINEGQALGRTPEGLALQKSVAMDRTADVEARSRALFFSFDAAADWFDWPRFLASDDPLLEHQPENLHRALAKWLEGQTREAQDEVLRTLERKPSLRKLRILVYPRDRDDRIHVLEAALADPETEYIAVQELFKLEAGKVPDLHRKLLGTRSGRQDPKLHEQIRESLDESLIEPLVKLLDDQDPKVRTLALETLQTIRSALEQKKEWQLIVEALKARKKE
jgi:hypothetical protein